MRDDAAGVSAHSGPAKTKAADAKAVKGKKAEAKAKKPKARHAALNKPVAGKKARGNKKLARKGRERIEIDTTQTASIVLDKGTRDEIGASRQYGTIIAQYATTYGVPISLAHAVIQVESNYRPNTLGSAGEIGLMQIKPATARMMGYSGSIKDLYNPATNIKYGMMYLAKAHQLGGGTTCGTILKYNAGHAARRMNPISAAYCGKVKRYMGV